MSLVFLIASVVMVVGLIVILFLPELPLRQASAVQERAREDAARDAAEAIDLCRWPRIWIGSARV